MKKIKYLIAILLILISFYFSCDATVALGPPLDYEGPVIEFLSPVARKAVTGKFEMTGIAYDTTGVDRLHLIAQVDLKENPYPDNIYPRQWLWTRKGGLLGSWHVSNDGGITWQPYSGYDDSVPVWNGNFQTSEWYLPVDMYIDGVQPPDGEYLFILQAWDYAGYSDANSYKTLVLIIDTNPPKVSVSNPFLESRFIDIPSWDLFNLTEWRDIGLLDRFQTNTFLMQWQLEDNHDVWSFDIRFYNYDIVIDGDPSTNLPENYIYKYNQNVGPPPESPDPMLLLKPNGSIQVPALQSNAGFYNDAHLQTPVHHNNKTIIKVVALCYDAAGLPNQEKELGYFIYWPEADYPWIEFSNLNPPSAYTGIPQSEIDSALMIYPGRALKANAFHFQGVKKVRYSLYEVDSSGNVSSEPTEYLGRIYKDLIVENEPHFSGNYSTNFAWEFSPPARSAAYVISATAYNLYDKEGAEYNALFTVQDITFPDFPTPPSPAASEPLYKAITPATPQGNSTINIRGTVSDATQIESLCFVWINPESDGYGSMSQLEYFKDPDYAGWGLAKALTPGTTGTEGLIDPAHPNRIWKLALTNQREDLETERQVYDYSVIIPLSQLNILGGTNQALRSQIFLFRAENPQKRTTIITYAPQGDELPPSINITRVEVTRGGTYTASNGNLSGGTTVSYTPRTFAEIEQFATGNVISVHGTWTEDSVGGSGVNYLPPATYVYNNVSFEINGNPMPVNTTNAGNFAHSSITHNSGTNGGTFVFRAQIGTGAHILKTDNMKDTLVVGAQIKDIGGNPSEDQASWLIKSDVLRLVKITSSETKNIFKPGDTIQIVLEFNKPVKLKSGVANPVLNLNCTGTGTTATAIYNDGQNMENTLQYFTYTVRSGNNTPMGSYLDVTGLTSVQTGWNTDTYPYSWEWRGEQPGQVEEVRITSSAQTPPTGSTYRTDILPTGTSNIQSLISSRNITVDTIVPQVLSITSTAGWYREGEIYINVKFNKNVNIGTGTNIPYLVLNTGASPNNRTDTNNVRVNGDTITFVYNIKSTDNTTDQLIINSLSGVIIDNTGVQVQASELQDKTVTGVYIDTTPPLAPTINIRNGGSTITTNVGGTTVTGTSDGTGLAAWTPGAPPVGTGNIVNLGNLYLSSLELQVVPNQTTANRHLAKLEYSTNYGRDWIQYTNGSTIQWNETAQNGEYNITARQTDAAGNVSQWAKPVIYNWDKGEIVERIDSLSPNATYTNNTGRNEIDIDIYFRKPVKFSSVPSINLNITPAVSVNATSMKRADNGNTVTYANNNLVTQLTFKYTVLSEHNTPASTPLAVNSFGGGFTATNAATDEQNVTVTNYINPPAAGSGMRLQDLKPGIFVTTGALTVSGDPEFTTGTVNTDGSYSTTLVITFNREIEKNTGTVSIIQSAASYRMPSVLTEAQRTRYRSSVGTTLFDNNYKKGTNGTIVSGTNATVDTATKYILDYDIDTASVTLPAGASPTAAQTLAEAFRQAEKISYSASAQAVTVNPSNRRQLIISFTGTNALQVPGGTYEVTIPAGFVKDTLDNTSPAININHSNTYEIGAVGGIARPFIRVNKPQETLSINNDYTNRPRIDVSFPMTTTVRMDCRTPNTTIRYTQPASNAANVTTNVSADNWYSGNSISQLGPQDNGNIPAQPAAIGNNNTGTKYENPITIGDNNYQGYIWRGRARAFVGAEQTSNTNGSAYTEELAFRTVLTYRIVNMAIPTASSEQRLTIGDQIWIRGGDSIGSSSISGFPITWDIEEFASVTADKTRAGIRLLKMTSANSTTYNQDSTWQWVTWDINVETYFDIILGRDNTTTSVPVLTQYGPRQWAYQRAGWTSYKQQYRLFPGKHRYMSTNAPTATIDYNSGGKGVVNFSNTFSARDNYITTTYP